MIKNSSIDKGILKMRAVAEDIIRFNPKSKEMNISQVMAIFYKIMAKHNICQGEYTETGRACNNPEWVMCEALMMEIYHGHESLQRCFKTPPNNLLAYGKKPLKKK